MTMEMKMDHEYLLVRLEGLITSAKRVPISNKLMIDEQELADLIDYIRSAIPEEIRMAKRIIRERDMVIAEAQQQADETLRTAHEQAEMLLDEQGLMAEAEARAKQYMEEVERQAQAHIDGADDYARQVLQQLRDQLGRHLNTIDKGLEALDSRQ